MATIETETSSEHTEDFQACVAEYRAAMAELHEIEERMTRCVHAMRADGASRERLLAASIIVGNVRESLKVSALPPSDEAARRRVA
ncbi:MAG: hypothetical protein ACLFU7_14860 [Armatimonadota bacterium]